MKRARDQYYFDALNKCALLCQKAAACLQGAFDAPAALGEHMAGMLATCREAAAAEGAIAERLHREFLAPVEPEDLMALSHALGNVVNCIGAAMRCAFIHRVSPLGEGASLGPLLVRCTHALAQAVAALPSFRKPRAIRAAVAEVKRLAYEADVRCLRAMGQAPAVSPGLCLYSALGRAFAACGEAGYALEVLIIKNN